MSAISQRIPNFIQGISDQPDELKNPGQLRKCENGYPDIVNGLVKRNGLKHLSNIPISQDGKWLHIQKEDPQLGEELYLANISREGKVRVFDARVEQEYEVCYANDPVFRKRHRTLANPATRIDEDALTCNDPNAFSEYFKHTNDQDLQFVTVNDYTFVTNRTVKPEMVRIRNNPAYYEVFVEIAAMNYGRSYTFGLFDLEGNEIIAPSYSAPTVSTSILSADNVLEKWIQDFGTGSVVTTTGSGVYVDQGPVAGTSNNRYVLSPEAYSTSYEQTVDGLKETVEETLTYPAGTPTVIECDDNPLGGNPNCPPAAVTWTKTVTTTSEAEFTVKKVGEGLYISRGTPFVASTTEEDIINVLSPSIDGIEKGYGDDKVPADGQYWSIVDNVSNLPRFAPHGYIVKVVNSTEDEDDYYLEFSSGTADVGGGSWQEIADPSNYNEIDVDKAPHQIIRNRVVDDQGNLVKIRFIVSPIDFEPRRAGNGETNKVPSWLPETNDSESEEIEGRPVNNIMFYRNRLVFLSDENICLSQAGDLFNFFKESMLGINDADPIDLNCSTNNTSVLYAGIVTNSGLVLFAPNSQFLFTTDGDVLSPRTAKSNVLSNYSYNTDTPPFKLGSNIGFLGTSGLNSVLYQMSDTLREGEPTVVEQSEVVSNTLPGGLNLVHSATEIGLVLLGKKDYDQVWQYKYFFDGQSLLQSAWYNWVLPGTLVYHWKTQDEYYLLIREPNTDKLSLQLHTQRDTLTTGAPLNLPYYVYTDQFVTIPTASMVVSGKKGDKVTTFSVPYTVDGTRTTFVYSLGTDQQYRGRGTEPKSLTPDGDNKTIVEVEGDWTNSDLAFGYQFKSDFVFPSFYVKTTAGDKRVSDTNASLTIHRLHLNLGIHTYCEFHLDRFGKDSYVIEHEARPMDSYRANFPAVEREEILTVPIYDRNTNYTLSLQSDQPGALFLFSASWEGDFTPRFYKRV